MKSYWQRHPVRCLIIDIDVWVKTYMSDPIAEDDMFTIYETGAPSQEAMEPVLYLRNWYVIPTDMRL